MRQKKYLVLGLLVCLCLSGCNKDIDSTISSVDFGESESTEEHSDNFKIDGDFGGRFDSKETTKSQEQIEKDNLKEQESLEEMIINIEEEKSDALGIDKRVITVSNAFCV